MMNRKFNLSIALPTYNRAPRLKKALQDLIIHINNSGYKKNIQVVVSNNGSSDMTKKILSDFKKKFKLNDIEIKIFNLSRNKGLDFNILNCYEKSSLGYVWYISDDDNLSKNAVKRVCNDIINLKPSFIYYNFEQAPYTKKTPYINHSKIFDQINRGSIKSLRKILNYPKITSYVLEKKSNKILNQIKVIFPKLLEANHSYMHCALTLETILTYKNFYVSNFFIAYPDCDHENHIDFPPYVGDELNEITEKILVKNNYKELIKDFIFPKSNKLILGLNTLTTFYKGKIILTPDLKKEISTVVKEQLFEIPIMEQIKLFTNLEIITLSLKFSMYYLFNYLALFMLGKKIAILKKRSDSFEEE